MWHGLARDSLEALGILTLVALAFEATLRVCRTSLCQRFTAGILFGAGAAASMMIPNEVAPGIFFDMRHVFIILSAPFGGWIATAMTAMAAALARLQLGGIGMTVGLVGIGISALASVALLRVAPLGQRPRWIIPLHGLCASLALASLFLLPLPTALSLLQSAGAALIVANLVGVVAGAHLLGYQQRRFRHERELAAEAKIDTLTGLLNRRAFDERTMAMATDHRGRRAPTAVMMIDIDKFKAINDSFGHQAGDEVLRFVALIILSCARGSDVVARYGGEEFALLLPGSSERNARAVSARIHEALARTPHQRGDIAIHVTVSIGACALAHLGDRPLSASLERADAALYEAKRAGRNQTAFARAA